MPPEMVSRLSNVLFFRLKMSEEENLKMKEEEEDSVKWVKYYSRYHHMLLVGEGDFSFSLSLARSFGSASNIVVSSFDPLDVVMRKYRRARSNLGELEKLGATILHRVDATKMKLHADLRMRKFDRIVFNFPHAGFRGKENQLHQLRLHRKLVRGFFKCASQMLRPAGEVHVNHKTTKPFCCWKLDELASKCCLGLLECVEFQRADYPGYNNKRGDGPRCDAPFPLGECSTFKFGIMGSHQIKKKKKQAKMGGCCMHEGSLLVLNDMPGTSEGRLPPPEHHDNTQQCFVEIQFGNPRISVKIDAQSVTHSMSIEGMPMTMPMPISQITYPSIYTRSNVLPLFHPPIAYYKAPSSISPPNAYEVVDQVVNSGAANNGNDHLPMQHWALGVLRTSSSHSLLPQLQDNDIEIFGGNDYSHHAAAAYMPKSHEDAYENRDGWPGRALVHGYKSTSSWKNDAMPPAVTGRGKAYEIQILEQQQLRRMLLVLDLLYYHLLPTKDDSTQLSPFGENLKAG
ncbi:hypothetical protein ACLOJK_031095 [Asimina triloba]